jgi:hypothetical protein
MEIINNFFSCLFMKCIDRLAIIRLWYRKNFTIKQINGNGRFIWIRYFIIVLLEHHIHILKKIQQIIDLKDQSLCISEYCIDGKHCGKIGSCSLPLRNLYLRKKCGMVPPLLKLYIKHDDTIIELEKNMIYKFWGLDICGNVRCITTLCEMFDEYSIYPNDDWLLVIKKISNTIEIEWATAKTMTPHEVILLK